MEFNDYHDLEYKYRFIRQLRGNVDIKKYDKFKKRNKNDIIYGWCFNDDSVLKESLTYLRTDYKDVSIFDILNTYIEVLEHVQKEEVK